MIENLKANAKEWNELDNDTARFKYLFVNKNIFILMLDNDMTFVDYHPKALKRVGIDRYDAEEILPELKAFDDYLGWSGGVVSLLEVIGLDAEPV